MRMQLTTWIMLAAVAGLAAGYVAHTTLEDAAAATAVASFSPSSPMYSCG